MLPTNIKTYYMDIAKANADDHPTWELLDDYLVDYGLTDLSPSSMLGLVERIRDDAEFAADWFWNQSRRG